VTTMRIFCGQRSLTMRSLRPRDRHPLFGGVHDYLDILVSTREAASSSSPAFTSNSLPSE